MLHNRKTMKKKITPQMLVLVVSACLLAGPLRAQESEPVRIVPRPVETAAVAGTFHITPSVVVSAGDEGLKSLAEYFSSLFSRPAGFTPKVVVGGGGDIRLERADDLAAEAYRLRVNRDGIRADMPADFMPCRHSVWLCLPR